MITRRHFMTLAMAATGLSVADAGFAEAPYEHRFMTVDDMRATDGLIVDIRTAPEWAQTGVIEGAVLETFDDPKRFLTAIWPEISDGRDLILICRSGNRTQRAAQILSQVIPNRVISIEGGMIGQVKSGYAPVKAAP